MVDPWAEPHRVPIVGSRAKASQDGDPKAVVDTSWVTSTKLASPGLTGPWFGRPGFDQTAGSVSGMMALEAVDGVTAPPAAGNALPIMCGVCLLYWFFGQYLPAPFNHRGYGFDQIIGHLSFGTEGFYGTPIYVSATYIFLFIVFGSFLEKAGMIHLTRLIAVEYGAKGIRANAVAPGTVRTRAWQARADANPDVFREAAEHYALGRIVAPEDVAEAVGFLASPLAGAITGVVLPVDCGLTAGIPALARTFSQTDDY